MCQSDAGAGGWPAVPVIFRTSLVATVLFCDLEEEEKFISSIKYNIDTQNDAEHVSRG